MSTEHSAIQKGTVQCIVAGLDCSRLLSTIRYNRWSFVDVSRILIICVSRWIHCRDLGFLKLIIQPGSLLLEDQRSETSSEGHNPTFCVYQVSYSLSSRIYQLIWLSFGFRKKCSQEIVSLCCHRRISHEICEHK